MDKKKYPILCLFLLISCLLTAQTGSDSSIYLQRINSSSLNKSANKVSKSLSEQKSDSEIAKEYIELARELLKENEKDKAEEYLKRAEIIYFRSGNTEKTADILRELAKIYETRSNFQEAVSYYKKASKTTKDDIKKQVNENDAERLRNHLSPLNQSVYIQQNIDLLEKKGKKEEKANVYSQMAETNLQLDKKDAAIQNYEKALDNVIDKPKEAIKIQSKIADVYVADKQYDKAININEKLIKEAQEQNDVETQIGQLQSLSSVYLKDNKKEEGLNYLQEAYDLSISTGKTFEAKKSLELLAEQYLKDNNYKKSFELYQGFLDKLEMLVRSDSSLVDAQLFRITEERIKQLEKERELSNELILRTNRFNMVLIGSMILMSVLLILIIRTLISIRKKNKKIALQSLRREMNPHFIFNSLNSINQFIAQNNELQANKYLTSYSRLMRNTMENSSSDFIRLNKEIEQLKEYLELEHLRFKDKFCYRISVDESLDTEALHIPNMLIQPHIENAIWHGLRYKKEDGILILDIKQQGKSIIIYIEDNGIGMEESKKIKTDNQKIHQSRGLINIAERIRLLNELYHLHIECHSCEKRGSESGVIVEIRIPLIDKI